MAKQEEHRAWAKDTLLSWAETFDNEGDEYPEDLVKQVKRYARGEKLKPEEYDNIIFHLWQSVGQEE